VNRERTASAPNRFGPLSRLFALLFPLIATAALAGIAAPSAAAARFYLVDVQRVPLRNGWKLSMWLANAYLPEGGGYELGVSLFHDPPDDCSPLTGGLCTGEDHFLRFPGPPLAYARLSRRSLRFDTGTKLGEFGRITLVMKSKSAPKRVSPENALRPGCTDWVEVTGKLRGRFKVHTSMPYFGTLVRHSFRAKLMTANCPVPKPPKEGLSVANPPCPAAGSHYTDGETDYSSGATFEAFTGTGGFLPGDSPQSVLYYQSHAPSGPAFIDHYLLLRAPEDALSFNWSGDDATINGIGPFSGQATFTASGPPTAWTVPWLTGCAVSGTQTPGTWSGESFAAHFLALGAIYPFATPLPGLITQVAVPEFSSKGRRS
jgi:hypothetical protein